MAIHIDITGYGKMSPINGTMQWYFGYYDKFLKDLTKLIKADMEEYSKCLASGELTKSKFYNACNISNVQSYYGGEIYIKGIDKKGIVLLGDKKAEREVLIKYPDYDLNGILFSNMYDLGYGGKEYGNSWRYNLAMGYFSGADIVLDIPLVKLSDGPKQGNDLSANYGLPLISTWYQLHLADLKQNELAKGHYIEFNEFNGDTMTDNIAVICGVGGGLFAKGFKGTTVQDTFRVLTNEKLKSATYREALAIKNSLSSYNLFNVNTYKFMTTYEVIPDAAKVQELKSFGDKFTGTIVSAGSYVLATGKSALLKALGFTFNTTLGLWTMGLSSFMALTTSTGDLAVTTEEGLTYKKVNSTNVFDNNQTALEKQSLYWDAVNDYYRKQGQTSVDNGIVTENDIAETPQESSTVIANAIKDLGTVLNTSISGGISLQVPEGTKLDIKTDTLTELLTNNPIQIAVQSLSDLLTNIKLGFDVVPLQNMLTLGLPIKVPEGLQLPLSVEGKQIPLNTDNKTVRLEILDKLVGTIENPLLSLDDVALSEMKRIADTAEAKEAREKELHVNKKTVLDNQIQNIPKNNEILDAEHKVKTQDIEGLDYAGQKAKA